ncbi:MAG: hypothetical protein U9Q96_02665 [Patescibacteria group bacterium]|nr:hypothetical protein [Patescibacteria group bacterium]
MIHLKHKKISVSLFIAIFVLGLFFPFSSKAWMMGLDAWIVTIIEMLVKLWFGVGITNFLLRMSNGFLGWVTDPQFIADAGGYTRNALVQEGWQITRDLVNMFFVLVMVGIGIATMLRTKGYEIKKLLPKAIVIILLINFTPIICGLIIDASNILTHFFLSAGTRGTGDMIIKIEAPQSSLGGQVISFLKGVINLDWQKIAFSMFHSIITIAFNIFASFLLFALGMIFLLRYIMLWILIILSPLAFFCYIMPPTKKIWDMWWKQFIQWCFIGIGASFFLYLTQRIVDIIGSGTFIMDPGTQDLQMGDSGLVVMFIYLVPMIFLATGFMAATMFAPVGAKQIIGLAKQGAKWPTSKKGKATRAKFKDWRQGKARRIVGPGVEKAMNKLDGYKPGWGQDDSKGTDSGRWVKRQGAEAVGLMSRVASVPGKKIFGEGATAGEKVTAKAYKEAKDRDLNANSNSLNSATREESVGILRAMAELGQIVGAMKQNAVSSSDLNAVFKHAVITNDKKTVKGLRSSMSHDEKVMQGFGEIIQKTKGSEDDDMIGGLSKEDRDEGYKTYQEKILAGLRKEGDFEKLEMTDELKEKLGEVAIKFYDPTQLAQAGKTLGRSFTSIVQNKAEEKGAAWFHEIDENTGRARNPDLPRYFASTGSGNISYGSLGIESVKDMESFRVESHNLEKALSIADGANQEERVEKLNDFIEETRMREEESDDENLTKILASARLAAERKITGSPRTIETPEGTIRISKEAAEDIRKQREKGSTGGDGGAGTGSA